MQGFTLFIGSNLWILWYYGMQVSGASTKGCFPFLSQACQNKTESFIKLFSTMACNSFPYLGPHFS